MKKKLTVLLALVLLVSLLGGCAAKSMDLAPNAPDSYDTQCAQAGSSHGTGCLRR